MNKIIDAVKTVAAASAEVSEIEKQRKQEQVPEEKEPKNIQQKFWQWQQREEEKWQKKQSRENPFLEMLLTYSEMNNFKIAMREVFPKCNYNSHGAFSAEWPYKINWDNQVFQITLTNCDLPMTMNDAYRNKLVRQIHNAICNYYIMERPEHLRFVLNSQYLHISLIPELKEVCIWFAFSLWGKTYLDNFIKTSYK